MITEICKSINNVKAAICLQLSLGPKPAGHPHSAETISCSFNLSTNFNINPIFSHFGKTLCLDIHPAIYIYKFNFLYVAASKKIFSRFVD